MGALGAALVASVLLLWIVSCQRQDGAASVPASSVTADADRQSGSLAADPFAGWPGQLKDLVIKARDKFGVPSLFPTAGLQLPEGATVVDVRTPAEVAVSAIPGARALSDDDLREAFLDEPHPGLVLVYCTAGWRSAEYTAELVKAGVQAVNLEGGLCAWALDGGALVDDKGQPTRRIHAYSDDFAECVPEGFEAVFD